MLSTRNSSVLLLLYLLAAGLAACNGGRAAISDSSDGGSSTNPGEESPQSTLDPLAIETTCPGAINRTDADVGNVLYLEEEAVYWGFPFTLLLGERVRVEGSFPYARYMSLQVYDETYGLRDGLAETQLQADLGHVNPALQSVEREGQPRRYTAYIKQNPPSEGREPNTLYSQFREIDGGRGRAPGLLGFMLYRIYASHIEGSKTGGVPLPRVVIENPLTGDERTVSPVDCSNVQVPFPEGVNELVAALPGLAPLEGQLPDVLGLNPPIWYLYTDFQPTIARAYLENPLVPSEVSDAIVTALSPERNENAARAFANIHNAYLTAMLSRTYGQVAVVRGLAPTYPDSRNRKRDGRNRPREDEQVRFWSFCMYSPILSQRYTGCVSDDEIPLDQDGWYTIAVSTAQQRPEHAREECGASWLPWGAAMEGLLAYRHLDVNQDWVHSAHQIEEVGQEEAVMQDVLPVIEYMSPQAFDELFGCRESR